jgi:uncharacterized membrane-anchored protein
MFDKRIIWLLIVAMILVQLLVPASMIWSKEKILSEGEIMHFRVAPIDPNDPFKGKFVILDFEQQTVPNPTGEEWEFGELGYALLTQDSMGYYYPYSLSKTIPEDEQFLEMNVRYSSGVKITVEYPFEKFYMEEYKAPVAEEIYFDAMREGEIEAYAVVYVNNGKAVLEDVQIDGVSIVELSENELQNRE